jgi:hypothetical protein
MPRESDIGNRQSAIANRQSPIGNRQSAIANRQSAVANRRSAICNIQSAMLLLRLVSLLIPLGIASVSATVLIPAEFREIVAGSEIIVHGRVVDVRPQWVDGRRQIESVVTVEVLTPFKGGERRTLEFKIPGGEIGRYRSVTVGAPAFSRGEEAFLFLSERDGDAPFVFGLNQGVFRIRQDRMSGRQVVVPPVLMAASESREALMRGSPTRRPLEVEAFGAQVRSAMAQQGGGR